MIRIELSNNFSSDSEIIRIYSHLAEQICGSLKEIEKCRFVKNGLILEIDEPEIKNFLLAKDFYNYEFQEITTKKLKKIFNYKLLTSGGRSNEHNRHLIINKMETFVCPYCNINYITTYNKSSLAYSTSDIDHFYPKKSNPAYGLCLYNFVPSCTVCNSRLKLDKDVRREDYTFPHEEGWGDSVTFEIENILDCVFCNVDANITLRYSEESEEFSQRSQSSAKLFYIEERYAAHSDVASKLLEKTIIYSESYQEELNDFIDSSNNDTKYTIFGNPLGEKEYGSISLGKLKRDILKQLDIY